MILKLHCSSCRRRSYKPPLCLLLTINDMQLPAMDGCSFSGNTSARELQNVRDFRTWNCNLNNFVFCIQIYRFVCVCAKLHAGNNRSRSRSNAKSHSKFLSENGTTKQHFTISQQTKSAGNVFVLCLQMLLFLN